MIHNQYFRTYLRTRESDRPRFGDVLASAEKPASGSGGVLTQISFYWATLKTEDIPKIERFVIERAASTEAGVTIKVFKHHNPTKGLFLAERCVTPGSCKPGGEIAEWLDKLRQFFEPPPTALAQHMASPAPVAVHQMVAPKQPKVRK